LLNDRGELIAGSFHLEENACAQEQAEDEHANASFPYAADRILLVTVTQCIEEPLHSGAFVASDGCSLLHGGEHCSGSCHGVHLVCLMSGLSFPLKRVFVALPLEREAKWQFQALQEALKPFADILRFQNAASPHLTLQFWQEVMEIEYHQIVKQTENIALKSKPFTMKCTGVSTFGSRLRTGTHSGVQARLRTGTHSGVQARGEDRVLFLDIAFSEELARLRKLCPWPSGKPFSPHITLARIEHPQRFAVQKKKVLKALEGSAFAIPVDRLRLFAEIDGRKQTPIAEYPFPTLPPPQA